MEHPRQIDVESIHATVEPEEQENIQNGPKMGSHIYTHKTPTENTSEGATASLNGGKSITNRTSSGQGSIDSLICANVVEGQRNMLFYPSTVASKI